MTPDRQLTPAELWGIVENRNIEDLSWPRLIEAVRAETKLGRFLPDGFYQIDPRNGDRILYNSVRSGRPHDNRPAEANGKAEPRPCIVCQGKITPILDVAELSRGFTFINKNLYPVIYPFEAEAGQEGTGPDNRPARGLHFLQWTSSYHDHDWHNMPAADRDVVFRRLVALEKTLLDGTASAGEPVRLPGDPTPWPGFVSIFKNYGRLVGGSLQHGHQQIIQSNVIPRRFRDNWRFEQERGEPFAAYLLRENPPELLLRDYGPAVLVVPYFMRRPFDMMLLLKDTTKRYLHELNGDEITIVARAWHEAIRVILQGMPELGREVAYNITVNSGPGAGLYFEFLPYTQEIGGTEHLGLYVCQALPGKVAEEIRKSFPPSGRD